MATPTAANAERGYFAHINPDPVKRQLLMPRHDLIRPKLTGLGMMPVGEDGVARPDSADVEAAIRVLQKDIVFSASSVCVISR